ncbi:MAG: SH3 domain-containing protein [Chloroflexota bacterium]|mgnify:CR=1 FL=1
MSLRQQSPTRRLNRWRGMLAVAVLLFAAACSLNPSPDNLTVSDGPPVVRLAAPLPNATYLEGVGVNIQAYVSNAGPDIDRVEITVDNEIVATLPQPNEAGNPIFPVTYSWNATGVGTHTIGVTAFRSNGVASEPATETITVISSVSPTEEPTPTSTPTSEPPDAERTGEAEVEEEATSEETESSEPDGAETEAESRPRTTGRPEATFIQGANVRRGPGTNFNPPIGAFAAGQTTEVLGRNPAGDWYKVRYYNADGWVFASLVEIEGDISNLPVDPGPPTPIPVTPTPEPPPSTPVPQTQANLVAGIIRLNPAQPVCQETFQVHVDLANLGSEATTTTGRFTVEDVVDGQVQERTEGAIPIIQAGQTVDSGPVPITVSTHYGREHTIVVVLNPDGSIPETGSGDNRAELKYTLQKGNCP